MQNPFFVDPTEALFNAAAVAIRDHMQVNAARADVPNGELLALPEVAALHSEYPLTQDGPQDELRQRLKKLVEA